MEHYPDIGECMAKIIALKDERVRRWNDFLSTAEMAKTVINILYYKDKYIGIIKYIVACQLMRGYCTEEEQKVLEICNHEINECDKALKESNRKAFEDKIISMTSEILSNH